MGRREPPQLDGQPGVAGRRVGPFWTQPHEFGGLAAQSLNQMRESAHGFLARSAISSQTEQGMARCILHLLDEIEGLYRQLPDPGRAVTEGVPGTDQPPF